MRRLAREHDAHGAENAGEDKREAPGLVAVAEQPAS
jgi:hypothetical protein